MKEDYPLKSFRLNKKTIKNLEKIKNETNLSYNMLFYKLINLYNNSIRKTNMNIIVKEGEICPHCNTGIIQLRNSRFGEFLACDQFPNCAFKQNIKEDLDMGQKGFKD